MSEETYDVIVVGGGIVGASSAYHSVVDGAATLLVDRDDAGRATSAGAGILAPEINKRDPDAWFQYAIEAVGYYPELVDRLRADGVGETSYARCGMLLVAADESEMDDFAEAADYIFGRREQRGIPSTEDLRTVTRAEAKALFPALTDIHGAIYYRNAARVDGRKMAAALRNAALKKGLSEKKASVEQLVIERDTVLGVVIENRIHMAQTVIIAGGAWSNHFGKQLGIEIPVEPQRGQIIHWNMAPATTGEWPIVSAFHGHYIVTWPGGRVVTGATRETGSGFGVQTSAAGIGEVIHEALRVAPGLAGARLLEIRVGLRPQPIDGLPILGVVPGMEGIVLATGHGPTGLQLGPYSGKVAATLAHGHKCDSDISAFGVARFQ